VAVEDGRAVVERVVEGGEAEDEAVEVAVAWLVFVLLWWEGQRWGRGKLRRCDGDGQALAFVARCFAALLE
jgi:hypothetical protein